MFDEYLERVVAIRQAGHELVARMKVLEKIALESDDAVARWVRELEQAAATAAEAQRGASELGATIVNSWPRPIPAGPTGTSAAR